MQLQFFTELILYECSVGGYIKTVSHHFHPLPGHHIESNEVSASLAGEVFMMSEGSAECEWIRQSPQFVQTTYHPINLLALMTADSATHLDPSIVCVDAKSAHDHLFRK